MSQIVRHYTKIEEEEFDFKNDNQRENLTHFFLLFSELYTLHNKSLLEDSSWEVWNKSLSTQMKSKFFSQAWSYVNSQLDFSSEYVRFVSDKDLKKEETTLKLAANN